VDAPVVPESDIVDAPVVPQSVPEPQSTEPLPEADSFSFWFVSFFGLLLSWSLKRVAETHEERRRVRFRRSVCLVDDCYAARTPGPNQRPPLFLPVVLLQGFQGGDVRLCRFFFFFSFLFLCWPVNCERLFLSHSPKCLWSCIVHFFFPFFFLLALFVWVVLVVL